MSTRMDDAQRIVTKRPPLPPVVLVVERNQALREALSSALRAEGYMVLAVADEALACDLARDNPFTLILLDAHSFQARGNAVFPQLRISAAGDQVPLLLMIIDQDSDVALIESRGVRADDYISKPLRWEELSACVKALLRKRTRTIQRPSLGIRRVKHEAGRPGEDVLMAGDLRIDVAQRKVLQGTHPVELESPLLFDLLVYLVRHRDAVLTREQLLRQVWGYDCTAECACDTRTVAVHIHWLRNVLGDDAREPRFIQTVRGIGYRFAGEARPSRRERE